MNPLPPAMYSTLELLAISSYLRHTFNIGIWLSKVRKHILQNNSHWTSDSHMYIDLMIIYIIEDLLYVILGR